MPAQQPNILVVMSDDHAQWAIGAYSHESVSTPAMDHLSRTGVRFDNAMCSTPVCSPARASFYTGLLPSQHGIHDHIQPEYDDYGWLTDFETLPETLSDAGYQTAISGKWHCGQTEQSEKFDHSFGVRDANGYHDWYATREGDRGVTDDALAFLRSRDPDRPFFHVVSHTGTHSPFSGGAERYVERHRTNGDADDKDLTYPFGRLNGVSTYTDCNERPREARSQYLAAVEGIDDELGMLLDELERQDILQDTVIIYTADHGLNVGQHGVWGKGNGTMPSNALEESIRIPLIVGGHEAIHSGQVRGEFVNHCDTYRTILEFADVEPPAEPTRVGDSYSPMLRNDRTPPWRNVQVGEYGPLRWARSAHHKLVRRNGGPSELFDLERDPREERDRLNESGYEAVEEKLDQAINDTFGAIDLPYDGTEIDSLPPYNASEAWYPS